MAKGRSRRKVVRATAFEVVDDDGQRRASFECDDIGAGLRIWHRGNCVFTVAVADDGSAYAWVGDSEGTPIWQTPR